MSFEPYVIEHGIDNFRFLVATQEGEDWYNPMKPYTLLEYQWVMDNVDLKDRLVLDCGGHHGHYAMILGRDGILAIVEPVLENARIIKKNMELNAIAYDIVFGAVAGWAGNRNFDMRSNGRFDLNAKGIVPCQTLSQIMPNAQVIKLDVEGAEFEILPDAISDMPCCDTWIVEVHPHAGDPNSIAKAFIDREFEVLKVDREQMKVVPYVFGHWPTHATIIARSNGLV
jgi:FkbM family methyltransferase